MFEETRRTAGRGLMFVFTGQIVALFSFIPFLGLAALIIGAVISLYGLYTLSQATIDYKNAFTLTLVGMVIGILANFFTGGFMSGVLSILKNIISFLVVYYVCTSTGQLLSGMSMAQAYTQAERARTIWMLYVVCMAISIVCGLLSYIPIINIMAALVSVVTAVVQLVASILYLIFLWNSQKLLQL